MAWRSSFSFFLFVAKTTSKDVGGGDTVKVGHVWSRFVGASPETGGACETDITATATLETIQGSASGCHNVHQGSAGSAPSCTNSVLTHAKQSSVAADHNVHLLHKLQASMMQDLMASPYASLHETVMPHNVPGRTPSQPDRR